MKIFVASNCQHQSIALSCRVHVPNCFTSSINMGQISSLTDDDLQKMKSDLNSSDLIVLHPHAVNVLNEHNIDISNLKCEFLPGFVFSGFQPDICYIHWDEARRGIVTSAIGDYHSSICVASYLQSRSAQDTKKLYNKLVFSRLGYLDSYVLSKNHMIEQFNSHGYDIGDLFDNWEVRCEPFMYSINHPRLYVISDLVSKLFNKIGVLTSHVDSHFYYNDPLMDQPIWPVYTELAESLGLKGSYLYKSAAFRDKLFNLDQFIHYSFESYDKVPRDVLTSVDAVSRTLDVIRDFKF